MADSRIAELGNGVDLEVYDGLEAQFSAHADAFIATVSQVAVVGHKLPSARTQKESVDKLALVGMALYELETTEIGKKPSFYPQWMRATQARLNAHTADNPASQDLLHETIFFEPSGKYAREFNSDVYRRVAEPHKTKQLPPKEFAKGVLEGTVTLRT